MKLIIAILICLNLFLSGCSEATPETLAKDSCDCFQKLKTIENTDSKLEQVDRCDHLYQSNYSELKDIEKKNDMSDKQVSEFEARFDNVYKNCK